MRLLRFNLLRCFICIASVMLGLHFSCSSNRIAGSGTEEGNVVTGSVIDTNGTPCAGVAVTIVPADFNPVVEPTISPLFTDTTDVHGAYRFNRVAAGLYVVIARNHTAATSFMARNVAVSNDSITTVPAGTLNRSGSIVADFSASRSVTGGYIYIPGTDIASPVDNDGFALLNNVPAGTISNITLVADDVEKRNVLRTEIAVAVGGEVKIEQPLWQYSRLIVLNTAPSGANVQDDVYDFPVLIRLNGGTFDFSRARTDGGDLRFAKNSTTFLPYEIERWDADAQRAEVWVKVDTVRGNDSVQSIAMYWGNAAAGMTSESEAVFDTATGYRGVWHMGEAVTDSVYDATANGYDGASSGAACPQIAPGVIGNCRAFDGVADYITMHNTANSTLSFPQDGYYTVSAWVRLDTFTGLPQLVVSKGYEQYFLRSTYFPSTTPSWEFTEFNEATSWQSSRNPATRGEWIFLAGVRQGKEQFLYCNGILVDSARDAWPRSVSRDVSNDLSVGAFLEEVTIPDDDGYCFLRGAIDEIRIVGAAQRREWVLLCYMNQRNDDRLVEFR